VKVRYEKTDVSASDTVRIVALVFAIAAIGSLFLLPLMWLLEHRASRSDPAAAPLARFEPGRQPPEPRLQERPFDDIRELRASDNAWLASYGWVDEDAGIAWIPIEDAMELVLKRGLPARPGAAPVGDDGEAVEETPGPPAGAVQTHEGGHP
jgi:hypothetical protein